MRELERGATAAFLAAVVLALCPTAAPTAAAQETDTTSVEAGAPPDTVAPDSLLRRIDLLERRIRALERRLDSLAARGADTAGAAEGLAAMREAAREAAEEARSTVTDTTGGGRSRTRSLQALNPEISVAGDFVGTVTSPAGAGGTEATAVPRGVEFSFQSALDPHTRMKVFAVREEGFPIAGLGDDEAGGHGHGDGMDVEEAYMYWVGLPGGFGARAGKFRQQFGLYNRWHGHALLDVDRPLPYGSFLGGSLVQTGAGVTLPSFALGPSVNTLDVEVARGSSEALFGGSDELTYTGRYRSFFDLSPSSYLQIGGSAVHGGNDATDLTSTVLGFDASFRWQPPGRSLYRDLQLKAEWFLAERETGAEQLDGHGGYLQASYRLDRRWVLGARADYVDRLGTGPDVLQLAPSITYWQSEWVRMRLQYNLVRPEGGGENHSVLLQVVWAAGPHKHDKY